MYAAFVLLVGLVAAVLASAAKIDEKLPDPLRVGDVVRIAAQRRPEIRAATAFSDAAAEQPAIVSALDDPMLMVQALHVPFREPGFNGGVMIQQSFPLSRIRGHRRRAAELDSRVASAAVGAVRLDVELAAAEAFFAVYEARALVEVLDAQAALAGELVSAALARYSAARGPQADVLRAETAQALVSAELGAMRARVRAAEALLNASLAREIASPIPRLSLAPVEDLVLQRIGDTARNRRPELAAARASVEAAQARVAVSRAMFGPIGLVQVGPAYAMSGGAGLMGTIGISLPIYVRWRRAGVREAEAMVGMARAQLSATENAIGGEAEAALAEVDARRVRLQAIRGDVVPRARQSVDAALASYGAGLVPLVSAVDAFEAYWSARADEVTAEVELGVARARLVRAAGGMP